MTAERRPGGTWRRSDARWPGVALAATGVAHLLIGVRAYGHELRRRPRHVSDAGVWFFVSGASLILLGADIAAVPNAITSPARRVRGLGLIAIALIIVSQRPASGAWALFPVAAALASTLNTPSSSTARVV